MRVRVVLGIVSCAIIGCAPADRLHRIDRPAFPVENPWQLSARIYSGGEPRDEEAFAGLAGMGVKTIVSVDGAQPDVATARKHGMRYVHIPIGYDGVPDHAGKSLARVVYETKGTIYVHCHHGKHRGPVAAAIACIAEGTADPERALNILDKAGTSRDYAKLWRDVEGYVPPPRNAKLPQLVETAEVESLTAAMAKIDRACDNLKFCRDSNWEPPANHPDIVPAQEALQLKEGLRESGRHLGKEHKAEFRIWLAESESFAQNLEDSLRANDKPKASERFQSLTESCVRCHKSYRD